jgi:hypothetical protein
MLGRLLSTSDQHQVSRTATPSHMSGPREGNLRRLVAVETAGDSESKSLFVHLILYLIILLVGELDSTCLLS